MQEMRCDTDSCDIMKTAILSNDFYHFGTFDETDHYKKCLYLRDKLINNPSMIPSKIWEYVIDRFFEFNENKERCNENTENVNQIYDEIDELFYKVNKNKDDIDDCFDEIDENKSRLNQCYDHMTTESTFLFEKSKIQQKKIDKLESTIGLLRKELVEIRKDMNLQYNKIYEHDNTIKEHNNHIVDLQRDSYIHKNDILLVKDNIDQYNDSIPVFNASLKTLNKTFFDEIDKTKVNIKNEINDLASKTNKQSEFIVSQLNKHEKDVSEKLISIHDEIGDINEDIISIKDELDDYDEYDDNLNDKMNDLNKSFDSLYNNNSVMKKNMEELLQSISEIDKNNKKNDSKINNCEYNMDAMRTLIDKISKEHDKMNIVVNKINSIEDKIVLSTLSDKISRDMELYINKKLQNVKSMKDHSSDIQRIKTDISSFLENQRNINEHLCCSSNEYNQLSNKVKQVCDTNEYILSEMNFLKKKTNESNRLILDELKKNTHEIKNNLVPHVHICSSNYENINHKMESNIDVVKNNIIILYKLMSNAMNEDFIATFEN